MTCKFIINFISRKNQSIHLNPNPNPKNMSTTFFLSLKPLSSPLLFPLPPTSTHYPPSLTTHFTKPKPHHTHNKIFPKIPLSSFKNNNNTPSDTECPVPLDQQPINEYQSLSNSFPFSWAAGDIVEYCSRLFVTGACFALFVGLPVSWVGSVGSKSEPIRLILGSASFGLFVVIVAVVRMYLGWAYVGNRLLSATVEYEETGWYDGQRWVKTAEVLARDRLLGSFSVKPVLGRLKNTLVVLGISLLMFINLFISTKNNEYINAPEGNEVGGRSVPGVYSEDSARNFEPDAFCGEPLIDL